MSHDISPKALQRMLIGPFSISEFAASTAYIAEGTRILAELRIKRRIAFPAEFVRNLTDDKGFEGASDVRNEIRRQVLAMGQEIQLSALMSEILLSLQTRKYVVTGTGVEHCGQDELVGGRLTKQFAAVKTRKKAQAIARQLGEQFGSVVFEVIPTKGVLPIYSF